MKGYLYSVGQVFVYLAGETLYGYPEPGLLSAGLLGDGRIA
jgi:hypothetical protein